MIDAKLVLIGLVCVTWFMCGLIWFVQIVHYPLFARVGATEFIEYERSHCSLTGTVVLLPMVIQALASLWFAMTNSHGQPSLPWINLLMVVAIWIITAASSIPCHNRLCSEGFSVVVHQSLLALNWVRVALWSLCSIAVTAMLYKHVRF